MKLFTHISSYIQIYEVIYKYMELYTNIWSYIQIYGGIYKYDGKCDEMLSS